MKKHHNVFSNDGKIGSQYQNFAHLLYRQNARMEVGVNPGGAIAVSSYKSQQQAQNYANGNNTKTVAVANFPNGRVTTTLQNSYSNNNYSRTHLSTNTIKNYRVQSNGRQNIKEAELANNSFSRSKSVYKDQDWARNGTSVSRSTASHSSGLPPAIKKSSSISADYGKNQTQSYQYSQINNNTKMINHTKIRMSSNSSGRSAMNTSGQPTSVEPAINPSMSGTGRSNEKAWTLKGSNIQADPAAGAKINPTVSTGNISNSKSVSQTRPDSKKLTALNRPPSGSSLFPQKVPNPVSEIGGEIGECTVIHVIDEAKKKQKDFK